MTPATERSRSGAEHEPRLIFLIGVLLFESALYSAVTPLLPGYAHSLGASKPQIGLLAAAYSAGLIPGSLLGGWIATRLGVRRTTVGGLLLFAPAVAAFGFADSLVALDVLRFIQGVACGLIWGGALTWLIAASPRDRRGRTLGSVTGAASFGTLIGPVLGTLAVAAGTELVFSLVGVVGLLLVGWVSAHPEPPRPPARTPETRPTSLREHPPFWTLQASGGLLLGAWLIMLEAGTYGVATALLPLRMSRFGATGVAIGATFLVAAALSMFLAPVVGRLTDRHGPRLLLATGLTLSALLVGVLPIPHAWTLLALLSAVALGGPVATNMTPAISMMTGSVERLGISLLVATTVVNLAYAVGETIGAPVASVVSQATSDAVPLFALSALMLATVLLVLRYRPTASTQPPSGADAREAVPH